MHLKKLLLLVLKISDTHALRRYNLNHAEYSNTNLPEIVNEHDASLPAWSNAIYSTCVLPTLKILPGAIFLTIIGATPVLSVAVGSVQVAALLSVPRGTV